MENHHSVVEGDINLSKSRAAWYKVLDPGTSQLLDKDAALFIHQSLSSPCLDVLLSCDDIYITDLSGKRYMDFHGNSVHHLGYRNPYITERLKAQLDILPFSPRRFANLPAIEFAAKLTSLMPGNLKRVLFAPGGTEVTGIALKLARLVTGRHKVVSLADSFHGASLDAIAIGGEEQFKRHLGLLLPEAINLPAPGKSEEDDIRCAEALDEVLAADPQIGAFIAETIRNTDVRIPSLKYWQMVREICTRHQVLLILDEIPGAFGRTGRMFCFEHYGIEPDLLCLGKSLGGGIMPFAALVARESYNIAPDVSLGHYTHEKSPLGAVAASAMLELIERDKLLAKVKDDEAYMKERLGGMKERHPLVGEVRGIGLLWGIELFRRGAVQVKAREEADKVMYRCFELGLSFKVSQGNVIQLCPPLIIKREQLETALQILEQAIAETELLFNGF